MAAFAALTEAERERLEMLAEEAAEVIHAVTKVLRHGYDNHHPDHPEQTNEVTLLKEITDFAAVVYVMADAGDLIAPDPGEIEEVAQRKLTFTHHQPYSKQCSSCRHNGTSEFETPCRDCVGFGALSRWEARS